MPKRGVVAALIGLAGLAIVALGLALDVDVWLWDLFVGDWWERFELNAERWVAIGTIALAAATFVLALHTRGMARETRREIDLTRQSIDAGVKPLLVDVPPGLFVRERRMPFSLLPSLDATPNRTYEEDPADIDIDSDERGRISVEVPLRNVGAGLALMGGPTLSWPDLQQSWRGAALQTAVPPNELTRLDFVVETASSDEADRLVMRLHDEQREFIVEVPYTDVNGGQATRTRAYLSYAGPEDQEEWRVDRLELFRIDSFIPFATLAGRTVNIAVGAAGNSQPAEPDAPPD